MLDLDGTAQCEFRAPESIAEVLEILQEHGEDASLLAGGQSLLVLLRQGFIVPSVLISLKRVAELAELTVEAGGARIGAMVRQVDIERSAPIRQYYTALAEAVETIATPQVRNQGTLGGNLCHADPTGDPAAALIALGATFEVAHPGGHRTIAAEDFAQDYMEVDLAPEELLTRIDLPPVAARSGSAYLKHRQRDIDAALVGVGVWLQLDESGSTIEDARIGLAGVGITPVRPQDAELALRGVAPTSDGAEAAAELAAEGCEPFSDTEGSEWYRREMVKVLLRRAVERAGRRAQAAYQSNV